MTFPPSLDLAVRDDAPLRLVRLLEEIAIAQAAQAFSYSEARWRQWMIVAGAAHSASEQLILDSRPDPDPADPVAPPTT
jgi:hypothetical protein